jgi:acylphosphatase
MAGGSDPRPPLGGTVLFEVEGRVQGVGFRYFVRQAARQLGVAGWVRNRPDGSVEVLADGPPSALDELELSLREGPPGSRVDQVRRVAVVEREHARDFLILG